MMIVAHMAHVVAGGGTIDTWWHMLAHMAHMVHVVAHGGTYGTCCTDEGLGIRSWSLGGRNEEGSKINNMST